MNSAVSSDETIRVGESDWHQFYYIRKSAPDPVAGYFAAIKAISALLVSEKWHAVVTGYYVNFHQPTRVPNPPICLRLTCFFRAAEDEHAILDRLRDHIATKQLELVDAERPNPNRTSDKYGGEELRFRRFLCTYSPIAVDVITNDQACAQKTAARFVWNVFRQGPSPERYRQHFETLSSASSPFYAALSAEARNTFWNDLANWPHRPEVDWAHFMVNAMLPSDPRLKENAFYEQPGSLSPLTNDEVDQRMAA